MDLTVEEAPGEEVAEEEERQPQPNHATRATRDEENQKLVNFIVTQRGVEEKLMVGTPKLIGEF